DDVAGLEPGRLPRAPLADGGDQHATPLLDAEVLRQLLADRVDGDAEARPAARDSEHGQLVQPFQGPEIDVGGLGRGRRVEIGEAVAVAVTVAIAPDLEVAGQIL